MAVGGVDPIHDATKRRLALAVLTAAAICIAPAPAALAGSVVSSERQGGAAAKHAIEEYWTPQRMRAARPLEAVRSDRGGMQIRRGPKEPLNHPAPFESGRVTDPAAFPNTVNGRIFGRLPGFGSYSCSGTVVDAPNHSVVMRKSVV